MKRNERNHEGEVAYIRRQADELNLYAERMGVPLRVRVGYTAAIKDHEIARAVNDLRAVALTYYSSPQLREAIAHIVTPLLKRLDAIPIDMVLYCPMCGVQHIDADESTNKMHAASCNVSCGTVGGCSCGFVVFDSRGIPNPYRSHLCGACGHIWRPADVPTNGVRAITTAGKDDSPDPVQAYKLMQSLERNTDP